MHDSTDSHERTSSRAGSRWRVFAALARSLGPEAFSARDFPNRVQRAFAAHREFGSRDRRVYRELLFSRCRCEPWGSQLAATVGGDADQQLAALLAEDSADLAEASGLEASFVAAVVGGDWERRLSLLRSRWPSCAFAPADLAPGWFRDTSPGWERTCSPDLLWRRPPLWIRIQTSDTSARDSALRELARAGAECSPSGVLPGAWRTDARVDLSRLTCFARGLVEVQDLGSQLILAIAEPARGGRWLDACAGAGGKTLQLASLLGTDGGILAEDPRREALGELGTRALRAGIRKVDTRVVPASPDAWTPPPGGRFDGVLVDAPCSGSGTWRRHPHLRPATSAASPVQHAAVQLALLRSRAEAVAPGGLLVYATCSLVRTENADVISAFLAGASEFSDATPRAAYGFEREGDMPGLTILPHVHDTDGFYVAVLRRAQG